MTARTLHWTQSPGNRHELRDGDAVIATMTVHGASLGSASAETLSGSWRLRKVGLVRVKIVITADENDAPIAEFVKVGKSRRLTTTDGREYRWVKDRLGSRFEGADGAAVISFSLKDKVTKVAGTSEIVDASLPARDADLLLVTGWYHLLLTKSDDDATLTGALATI